MAGGMSHGPGVAVGTQGAPLRAAAAPILLRRMPFLKLESETDNIRAEGAAAIAEALRGNEVLKNIDLSYNNLGDEGRKAIHDAVSGREGFELEM